MVEARGRLLNETARSARRDATKKDWREETQMKKQAGIEEAMTDTTMKTGGKKIDKPTHGTGEWAKHNVNIQRGCGNRCAYCYASAMAIRFGRKTAADWGDPEIDQEKVAMRRGRKSGRIMFPTSHDLHEGNLDACATVLKGMLAAGNDVLVVSKSRLGCVRRLCDELAPYKAQVTFRFTIGSADDAALKAWEPGAPTFAERIACLRHAFDAGFMTSVSCEPMLDADIDTVIEKARPYVVDSIWLGRANQLRQIVAINARATARRGRWRTPWLGRCRMTTSGACTPVTGTTWRSSGRIPSRKSSASSGR
jgi:DNA repair photolyase